MRFFFFFCNATATTEIYTYRHTLSLHDALPICALCYLLRCDGRVVAFTWCERDSPPRPRLGRAFGPTEAYLFDAYTAPTCRGRNLLPFLRQRLYRELRSLGCTGFFSSPAAINRPAHRSKQKPGQRPQIGRAHV